MVRFGAAQAELGVSSEQVFDSDRIALAADELFTLHDTVRDNRWKTRIIRAGQAYLYLAQQRLNRGGDIEESANVTVETSGTTVFSFPETAGELALNSNGIE